MLRKCRRTPQRSLAEPPPGKEQGEFNIYHNDAEGNTRARLQTRSPAPRPRAGVLVRERAKGSVVRQLDRLRKDVQERINLLEGFSRSSEPSTTTNSQLETLINTSNVGVHCNPARDVTAKLYEDCAW